ncbi:MAG: mannosyltransferase family protein [Sulfobacillus sp.]
MAKEINAPSTTNVRTSSGVAHKVMPSSTIRIRSAVWLIVLSRLFFMEVGSLAYLYLPHAWVEAPPGTLPPTGSLVYRAVLGMWVHWDGLWYYSIANFGYAGRATATAFFPLYPLAMRILGGGVIGGLVASGLAFSVALWFLMKLTAEEFGPRAAWFAGLAMAFFPTAFYANAVYSESLFLALAVSALYYARKQRYWVAGPLAALTTLVSMYGILLAAPLFFLLWQHERPHWKRFLHALWPVAGLGAYMGFLITKFGDPLVFEHAQSNWGRHFDWVWNTLWSGWVQAFDVWRGAINPSVLFQTGMPSLGPSNAYDFLFAVVAILVAVVTVKRMPLYLWSYMVLALMVPLSYPAAGTPLMSMPRLVLESFPVFIGVGLIMSERPWVRWVYFGLGLPLGALFVSLFATAHWVA